MKMILLLLITAIFLSLTVILVLATYRTWKTQSSPNQKDFLNGKVEEKLPDGFFKGKVTGYNGSWQGKKFAAKAGMGINIFNPPAGGEEKEVEKYPFKLYKAKGLIDNREVIRIDYNLSENPFWVRFVVDEIVETDKDQYLGKIHLNIIPGLPFSIGYFKLQK